MSLCIDVCDMRAYVCTYEYVHVQMFAHAYDICVDKCMYVFLYVSLSVCVYVCMYFHALQCNVCMYMCMYVM